MEPQPIEVLFIVGPTASGKSALSLQVAHDLQQVGRGAEIICADSRTIYTGLDIATAKPTASEQAMVPHWGLDLVTPDKRYSAAAFQLYAQQKIAEIKARHNVPIIVGGTGLYIDCVLFNYKFGPAADLKARARLELMSIQDLQQVIAKKGYAMPQNLLNKRYLIRAIEQGGVNASKSVMLKNCLVVGILPNRDELKARIRKRATAMLQSGALQETEKLFTAYGFDAPAAAAPFYRAFIPYYEKHGIRVDDTATDDALLMSCLDRFATNDWQLAKRQITWFKRNEHISWFVSGEPARDFIHSALKVSS